MAVLLVLQDMPRGRNGVPYQPEAQVKKKLLSSLTIRAGIILARVQCFRPIHSLAQSVFTHANEAPPHRCA